MNRRKRFEVIVQEFRLRTTPERNVTDLQKWFEALSDEDRTIFEEFSPILFKALSELVKKEED